MSGLFARLPRRLASPQRTAGESRERGSSTVETAILVTVLIGLFLTVMQGSLWWWSRNVTLGAAEEAARTTAQEHGSPADGRAAASSYISQSKAGLTAVTINVTRSATSVTATVSGRAMTVIPGFNLEVRQAATLPVERITR